MTNPERPDQPDLPTLEEDEPDQPRGQRYLLSREVRGWAAGLAAVLVAVAAIAPSIDFGDVTGALVGKDALHVPDVGNDSCTASDQTGGVGGQSVHCTFTCPAQPGSLNVNVDADDNDAQVSGTAECGGDTVHCSGKNSCSSNGARRASGAGACSADSDEAIDSGLFVECSASVTDGPGGIIEDTGSEICPVSEPVAVCLQPVCHRFAGRGGSAVNLKEQCQTVWEGLAQLINDNSIVVGYWTDGVQLAGLSCRGVVCTPLELT